MEEIVVAIFILCRSVIIICATLFNEVLLSLVLFKSWHKSKEARQADSLELGLHIFIILISCQGYHLLETFLDTIAQLHTVVIFVAF